LAARTAADGVVAREWLEMGGEKKPLGMSELGRADGCGRRGCNGAKKEISELGCADGCGRLRTAWVKKGVGGKGWGKKPLWDERAWLRGRLRTAWVQGSGWKWVREEAAGDERAWLRGRSRWG